MDEIEVCAIGDGLLDPLIGGHAKSELSANKAAARDAAATPIAIRRPDLFPC